MRLPEKGNGGGRQYGADSIARGKGGVANRLYIHLIGNIIKTIDSC